MALADAATTADTARVGDGGRYILCTLGGETYALDIRQVSEIIELRDLTEVPMMPPYVRGVLNLRGRVLPVVDLLARFGKGTTEAGRRSAVVIVDPGPADEGAGTFGVVVDAVTKVVQFEADDLDEPPMFGTGLRPEFISSIAHHDGDVVVVLELASVLVAAEHAGR